MSSNVKVVDVLKECTKYGYSTSLEAQSIYTVFLQRTVCKKHWRHTVSCVCILEKKNKNKKEVRLGDFTTCYKCRCISLLNSDAPHTYLSHSSTLNVGVVVEGVEGELCLLTRWFREVSCTLSRFPCIALL